MSQLEDMIKETESLYPNHKWLARQLHGASDIERFGDGYLVHIYRDNEAGQQIESYLSSGAKLEHAFRGALARAARSEQAAEARAKAGLA